MAVLSHLDDRDSITLGAMMKTLSFGDIFSYVRFIKNLFAQVKNSIFFLQIRNAS